MTRLTSTIHTLNGTAFKRHKDVFEKDGIICMMPVAVYLKKYLDELRDEINDAKAKIASGEQPVFDNVDALFAKLETD